MLQMLLVEEFERGGCQVEFADWPMSQDPHDQLQLQIRGAVAEYERSLIAERMRRGDDRSIRLVPCSPGPIRQMAIGWPPAVRGIPQECAWSQPRSLSSQSSLPARLARRAKPQKGH
jgi:Resolvase, N terminal domain